MAQQPSEVDEQVQLVSKRLETFAQNFVERFEKYQSEYIQVLTNQIKQNPGKNAVLFEKVCRVGKAGGEILDPISKAAVLVSIEAAVEVAHFVEGKYNKEHLKNIAPRLFEYERDPEKGRHILVEGACQVFLCFEAQFMNIGKAGVWEMAIVRVAEDAVRRVIDYLTKNRDKVLISATIFEGVIHGKTKTYDGSMSVFEKGHKVELDGENFRTSDIFKTLGLTYIDEFGTQKFISPKGKPSPKNGIFFRLLSEGEKKEEIHLEKGKYKSIQISKDEEYTYRLTQEYIGAKHEFILRQIKSNQRDDFEEIQALATEHAQSIIKLLEDKHDEIMTGLDENKEFLEKMQLMFKGNFERLEDSGERILGKVQEVLEQYFITNSRDRCVNRPEKSDLEPMRFLVKRPVDSFTGRDAKLRELNDFISRKVVKPNLHSQMTVLSGKGGVGKTQLALRYVQKYCQDMDVLWMDSESASALKSSFVTLASDFCEIKTINANGDEMEISSVVQKVYKFLCTRATKSGCLIIFDNGEEQIDFCDEGKSAQHQPPVAQRTGPKAFKLKDFLPVFEDSPEGTTNGIRILITSRYDGWGPNVVVSRLEDFTQEEALNFVKNSLKLRDTADDEAIGDLVNTMQRFPLLLEQAVAYIHNEKHTRCTTTDRYTEVIRHYLEKYKENALKILDDDTFLKNLDHKYNKTTFTVWNTTSNKILGMKYGKLAIQLLRYMSFMHSKNIHTEMFYRHLITRRINNEDSYFISEFADHQNTKEEFAVPKDEIQETVKLLAAYSMVKAERNQEVLSIHRLLQEVIRLEIEECNDTLNILSETATLLDHARCSIEDSKRKNQIDGPSMARTDIGVKAHGIPILDVAHHFISLFTYYANWYISARTIRKSLNSDVAVFMTFYRILGEKMFRPKKRYLNFH